MDRISNIPLTLNRDGNPGTAAQTTAKAKGMRVFMLHWWHYNRLKSCNK
jgi:hypothetical protein